ncbi:radical SAM protein [Reichenbachiella sp. MALMAid0571]|uniref:B12-binding domain-containing radical SAM protein n=1 Tax=Reichenbachiella sp. MALMAid0571 TaxID=3143939 RepID=UPI0032DFFCBD
MGQKILLITPPFTQLNTPYPATPYLKGFLNIKHIDSNQVDLGIEVILELFSSKGLEALFEAVNSTETELSVNSKRIYELKNEYIRTIDTVIGFLQDKNPTLAHIICEGNYLPEASRFDQIDDLEWAFGTMGSRDKARHLATLYLEDISDLIKDSVDGNFGFSRYAERLGLSATSFDPLHEELQKQNSFIDSILLRILKQKIDLYQPDLVALSIPFPGNLYGGLKCGKWLKYNYPETKIVMGGGYANTELRTVKDIRVFDYIDFISLDDGEAPIMHLIEHLAGQRDLDELKRILTVSNGEVKYFNGSKEKDVPQREVGTPDYSDLPLDKYLSVIEIANPMHRLWSDGRWNKLTLAHGCYWGKCTFCDISLDYIKRYEPITASVICDRIEQLIAQTGQNGFHFVDEAAPPALMRDVALEIIRRGLTVVWWTNIRFEKSFTSDLCRLLAASGCIAVSGGLEVASDRLLEMIQKGVTVAQVATVAANFTEVGIKVHAYLMYGFPTQTAQETIDSLEVVRQMFMHGIIQSGFWHQFAMTAHSPVGMFPEKFMVEPITGQSGSFANNDLQHIDRSGAIHEVYSEGLKKSIFNYMHGICFDFKLNEWFEFNVPKTKILPDYIEKVLLENEGAEYGENVKIIWLGNLPSVRFYTKKKKAVEMAELSIVTKQEDVVLNMKEPIGKWLSKILPELSVYNEKLMTYSEFEKRFNDNQLGDMKIFMSSYTMQGLRDAGLLFI